MEGVDRNGVVGIGVGPSAGDGSVVDGEDLHGGLVRQHGPVDEALEVAEVSHTKATFAAQGEDGHGYTCYSTSIVPDIVEVKMLLARCHVLDDVGHTIALLTCAEAVTIDSIAI